MEANRPGERRNEWLIEGRVGYPHTMAYSMHGMVYDGVVFSAKRGVTAMVHHGSATFLQYFTINALG